MLGKRRDLYAAMDPGVFLPVCCWPDAGAAPQDSPVGEEDGISGAVSLPVTEDAIRAVYGAEGAAVLAVTSYEGDFLVELGPEERPALDWGLRLHRHPPAAVHRLCRHTGL